MNRFPSGNDGMVKRDFKLWRLPKTEDQCHTSARNGLLLLTEAVTFSQPIRSRRYRLFVKNIMDSQLQRSSLAYDNPREGLRRRIIHSYSSQQQNLSLLEGQAFDYIDGTPDAEDSSPSGRCRSISITILPLDEYTKNGF